MNYTFSMVYDNLGDQADLTDSDIHLISHFNHILASTTVRWFVSSGVDAGSE